MPSDNNHKFVFLCGLHRSGTTLVAKTLAQHPDISGFHNTGAPKDEGQHLQNIYPTDRKHGGPGLFGLKRGSYFDENSRLTTPQNGQILFEQWAPYWDLSKKLMLEKTPSHINKTRMLQKWFPNAHFIIVLRHPLASGYATKRFTKAPVHKFLENWLRCYECFEKDLSYLKHVTVYKYEDFIIKPNSIMDGICGFLDIHPVPFKYQIESNINQKYFSIWEEKQDNWLTKHYANFLIKKYETRFNHFGYSLIDLLHNAPYLTNFAPTAINRENK